MNDLDDLRRELGVPTVPAPWQRAHRPLPFTTVSEVGRPTTAAVAPRPTTRRTQLDAGRGSRQASSRGTAQPRRRRVVLGVLAVVCAAAAAGHPTLAAMLAAGGDGPGDMAATILRWPAWWAQPSFLGVAVAILAALAWRTRGFARATVGEGRAAHVAALAACVGLLPSALVLAGLVALAIVGMALVVAMLWFLCLMAGD